MINKSEPRKKQNECGIIFAMTGMFIILVSLIFSFRSTSEFEKLNSLIVKQNERFQTIEKNQHQSDTLMMELKSIDLSKQEQAIQIRVLQEKIDQIFKDISSLSQLISTKQNDLKNERQSKIEEKQKQFDILMMELKSIDLSKQQQAIQISVLQEKIDQIFKDLSSLTQFPTSLSVLQNDFKYLSELKPEVEFIKKELVKAQADILVTGTQINYYSKIMDQVVAQVDALEKDQRNILISESSLITQVNSNSNRIDQTVQKVDALETRQSGILTNQSSYTSQFNQISNQIDQLTTKVDVLPVLSVKVDSLALDVPSIQDSINSLNLKINSDTFNKVEMFGPYYPNSHSIQMSVTNSGYTLFQTIKPCILSLKGKAIVTLIATGHTYINTGDGQIFFLVNGTVNLPETNLYKWLFGVQYSRVDWVPVNLTQEFMLEVGVYQFALGGYFPYSGSATLSLHAVSFVAKVTYIS